MADGFVDHGAYASALGTTPTWGVPQEGDGSSKDAATTAAIASVLFGSVPTSGTISVCGVSISTTGVLSAGSVGAAADALAANINAATTTVGASVAVGTPQLRNLVFARGPSGGAPAGTCEIMMRVGSATLNHASNANVAIAQTLSPAATLTQFAGGSGGCWGWLVNPAAIGVSSSIAVRTYGMLVSKPMVWTFTPTQLDFIWARTQNGKTITLPAGQHIDRGNVGFPLNLIFDTNTKWTGDSGAGVVRVELSTPTSGFTYFRPENSTTSTCAVSYSCLKKGNLEIAFSAAAGSSTMSLFDSMAGAFVGRGIRFVEATAPSANSNVWFGVYTYTSVRLYDCDLDCSAYTRTNLNFGPRLSISATGAGVFHWIGGAIKFNLNGAPPDVTGFFNPAANMGGAGTYGLDIRIEGVSFTSGSAYKIKWQTSTTAAQTNFLSIVLKDNSGLNQDSGFAGMQNAFDWRRSPSHNSVLYLGGNTGRGQRREQWNGVAEWNPDASPAYPVLGATQQDGTIYSIRLYWLSSTASNSAQPFSYTSARRNRLADGVRTIVQEVAFDSTKGIDGKHLSLQVRYIDADGIPRTQNMFGSAPTSSAASWTGIESWSNFAAYKWTVVTSYPVKQNTMIECEVSLNGPPPGGSNTDVFLDPEPSIT